MATVSCHSNQSSYPIETKKNAIIHDSRPLPIDAKPKSSDEDFDQGSYDKFHLIQCYQLTKS